MKWERHLGVEVEILLHVCCRWLRSCGNEGKLSVGKGDKRARLDSAFVCLRNGIVRFLDRMIYVFFHY